MRPRQVHGGGVSGGHRYACFADFSVSAPAVAGLARSISHRLCNRLMLLFAAAVAVFVV